MMLYHESQMMVLYSFLSAPSTGEHVFISVSSLDRWTCIWMWN